MGKYKVIDGNEACAHISYMFTEIAGIYPITPASPMSEYIDKWSTEGRLNLFNNKVKLIEMQKGAKHLTLPDFLASDGVRPWNLVKAFVKLPAVS